MELLKDPVIVSVSVKSPEASGSTEIVVEFGIFTIREVLLLVPPVTLSPTVNPELEPTVKVSDPLNESD